jgi:hypothetical protein
MARFQREMAVEGLDGRDLECVDWAAEAIPLEELEDELAELGRMRVQVP